VALGVLSGDVMPRGFWREGRARSKTYLKNLAESALDHRRPELALRLIDRAVGVDLKDPTTLWVKTKLQKRLARHDEAEATWTAMLACPGGVDAFLNLGFELKEMEKVEETLQVADIACAIDGKVGSAHLLRSWALERLGRLGEAIKASRSAMRENRGNLTAVINLGRLLRKRGDDLEALQVYETALRKGAASPALMDGHAWALFELGRVEEALKVANGAAQHWPNDEQLQGGLKRMNLRLKKTHGPQAAPGPAKTA
jgi:tetratricopeptide (TPR) repeat protein